MTSIVIGLCALLFVIFTVGGLSALFLQLMSEAQSVFLHSPSLVWLLPVLGLLTGWVYFRWGQRWPSTPRILHSTHEESPLIPFKTAIMIFGFTILSQVFGASTGRESTAVQFGAGLSETARDFFLRFRKNLYFSRDAFIRCGLAAGFGAVFGIPWAGAIFALEATPSRKWPWRHLLLTICSAWGAHLVALAFGARHFPYLAIHAVPTSPLLVIQWLALGVCFGSVAKVFLLGLRFADLQFRRLSKPWLRPAVGGLIVAVLTAVVFRNTRYNGLGVPLIEESFRGATAALDFLWKSIFTVVSTGSGLKGGEVTPLMAIGATLGSTVAPWVQVPVAYAASLGLVAVFSSSAHIPWTGAVMAWEFFGFEAFLPAFIICWVARKIVGLHSLFKPT